MNKKGFGVIEIVVAILILSLLGIGGYLLWQQQTQPSSEEPIANANVSPTQSVSPTSIPDDVYRGWKEYRNDELGISFRYPEYWIRSNSVQKVQNYTSYINVDESTTILGGVYFDGALNRNEELRKSLFNLTVFSNSGNLTIQDWIRENDINRPSDNDITSYNLVINGSNVFYTGKEEVYFSYDNKVYAVSMGYINTSGYPENGYQELFDKILTSVSIY